MTAVYCPLCGGKTDFYVFPGAEYFATECAMLTCRCGAELVARTLLRHGGTSVVDLVASMSDKKDAETVGAASQQEPEAAGIKFREFF
jgi:hypothetical protein